MSPRAESAVGAALARLRWPAAAVAAALLVAVGTDLDLRRGAAVRAVAVAGAFVGEGFLLVVPGLATLATFARRRRIGSAASLALVFAGSGLSGFVAFWAWYAAPGLGAVVSVAVLVVAVGVLTAWAPAGLLVDRGLLWPLLTALGVGAAFTAVIFLEGGLTAAAGATHSVSVRVWLTPDNKIPLLFANRIADGVSLRGYLLPTWHSSDRPPLQTGLVLLQFPLFGDREFAYQLLSTSLQMAWLPAAWVALRARGYGDRRCLVVVLATAMTGVVFVNSVFVWPKMLAGGFAIAALAVLVSRSAEDRQRGAGLLVAALCGLSFLSHGGTAFALIALAPSVWSFARNRATWRGFGAVVLVLGALYAPWFAYQRLVDPPGDRLVKWQLAGVIDEDPRSAPQALVDAYTSLSVGQLLDHKLGNLLTFVARPAMWKVDNADPGWTDGFLGTARIAQLNNLLLSAGPLLLGLLALGRARGRRILGRAPPLAVFTALGLAAWALLLFGGLEVTTIIATGPYATVVMFLVLLALCVTALPTPWAGAVLCLDAAWFVLCWFPGIRFVPAVPEGAGSLDWAMVALLAAALALLGVVVRSVFRVEGGSGGGAGGWGRGQSRRAQPRRGRGGLLGCRRVVAGPPVQPVGMG